MKITKLYVDSSLDFKLWGWKRINEYSTADEIEADEVIGKYIIAKGCETLFGNVAAYATTFNYRNVLKYDAVIYVGNTYVGEKISSISTEFFRTNYTLEWSERIFPTSFNADIFNAICHCIEIPFIFISTDNEISAEVAEAYSGNGYYILTSPYELQHTLHKLNVPKNAKVLLLVLDNDLEDEDSEVITDILDNISVVENTLSNWK